MGQPAPDFTATTVDGKTVKLSDFRGQPVWLTFGASWCQPCRAENPDIQATAEKYAADGLVVLAVFISEDAAPRSRTTPTRVGLDYLKVADPATQHRLRSTGSSASRPTSSSIATASSRR